MEKFVLIEAKGELGDQLFIIASSYSYAKKENANLKILKTKSNPEYSKPVYWETLLKKLNPYLIERPERIDRYVDYKYKYWDQMYPVIWEENLDMGLNIGANSELLNRRIRLYKYFSNDKEDIKRLFKPEAFLVEFVKNKYNILMKQKDRVVVIHSCQKQYETKPYFYKLGFEYYKKAIDKFIDNKPIPLFLLCIDDEKLCDDLKTYIEINNNESYILKDDELLTFTLLQEFNNFIMSNCSFIWWCVWLSEYKHVIVPKEWFLKSIKNTKNYDDRDLYDDEWIRMD